MRRGRRTDSTQGSICLLLTVQLVALLTFVHLHIVITNRQPTSSMVLAAQHTLRAHKGPVNVCVYNKTQDSQFVLSGGQDRTIRLWNASKGTHIKSFESHGYEVLSIDWCAVAYFSAFPAMSERSA